VVYRREKLEIFRRLKEVRINGEKKYDNEPSI